MQHIITCIDLLAQKLTMYQERDGSFAHYSSADAYGFRDAKKYYSIFPTALLLSAVHDVESSILQKLRKKSAKFLLEQKSDMWSYNYWSSSSTEYKALPYPDDLDDTFCALTALWQYDQHIIDGGALAHIVSLLTFTEQQEGGPYRTWLVPEDSAAVWKDVDIAVNSNIAYFLSLQDVELPQLTEFIERHLSTGTLHSPYYATVYPILYFISRWYRGKKQKDIIHMLFDMRAADGSWGNVQDTALAILALLNVGAEGKLLEKSINYVCAHIDEIDKPYALYVDPSIDKKKFVAGSPALTIAFCISALQKYAHSREEKAQLPQQGSAQKDASIKLYKEVIHGVEKKYKSIHPDIYAQFQPIVKEVLESDTHKQVVLLPYYVQQSLHERYRTLSTEQLRDLGMASLYGWIAYTIYDDFLDEEGNPALLSVATIALRELTRIFLHVLPQNTDFHTVFIRIMDDLDAANTWETTHCRLAIDGSKLSIKNFDIPVDKQYRYTYQKSYGHALGAIAMFSSLGFGNKTPEMQHIMKFFQHYLIARQLNDDAHDWEEDLKKGHINPVCAKLLSLCNRTNIDYIDIHDSLDEVRKLFWNEVIVEVYEDVFLHCKKARNALSKISIIQNPALFESLIYTIESSMKQAQQERKKTLAFLQVYEQQAIQGE